MNMLRVWGGGIYEPEIFYDICDELGILVWQDFMFSCALYPGDDKFLNSVFEEATYQVRRLRHHPSIALWCGNNEIEMGWQQKLPPSFWEDYLKLFHGVLPQVCETEDPTRIYWPSSPASDLDAIYNPNDPTRGDTHYWGVWHGQEPFEFYHNHLPRFISEFGFQSFPEPQSIAKFTTEEDHDILTPVMLIHQKNPQGNMRIKNYMEKHYKIPQNFDHFLWLSQLLQAEGIKIGVEHFRRIRPRCMGCLYWQINDCWPVASWASIDYYGRWKALHYFARRFYAPILVSPNLENENIKFHIISDKGQAVHARLKIIALDFKGTVYSKSEKQIVIQPNESSVYHSIAQKDLSDRMNMNESFIYCRLEDENGNIISENSFFFELPKNLKLNQPDIKQKIEKTANGFAVSLSSKILTRSVILTVAGVEGHFEDNFFDLYPGQTREIRFNTNSATSDKDFKKSFSWITLFELMEMKV
jgi:beta-mannosidase